MGKRSVGATTMSPAAVADTISFVNQGFIAVVGGTSIQRNIFSEIYLGGQASASSPMYMTLGRDSQIGATPTLASGGFDGPLDPAMAAASLAVPYNNCVTTFPQRSAASNIGGHLLELSFNAFGGIVRWVAAPGSEIQTVGNTASLGEVSLSNFTGGTTAALGAHMIYETV